MSHLSPIRWIVLPAAICGLAGCGAGAAAPISVVVAPPISTIMPSAIGTPLGVASYGDLEFISVQGSGQIFSYSNASGLQVQAAEPYVTPCQDPSGLVVAQIAGKPILAAICYDTGSLLTLSIHGDGSLSALGLVTGLGAPYPGIAFDGTSVLVPLHGVTQVSNGGVAKVNLSSPNAPVITGTATLASPPSGGFANPGALVVNGGYIYVAAGSESAPINTSSTVQVIDEATMSVVGNPLVVLHSPQQLAVSGNTLLVTFYDAMQLQSIDISKPTALTTEQIYSLSNIPGCSAIPVAVRESEAYVGCYPQGDIEEFNIINPSNILATGVITGVPQPQEFAIEDHFLIATSSQTGGVVTRIDLDAQ